MATKEKAEKNMVSFEFKVSAEEFEAAIQKAYKKNVGKINIQGFRKGKAPRAIIERYYGKEVFYEDAVNIVLPDAYDKAIEEQNIEAVAQPEIDVKEISAETGVVFTAKVAVKPEFELGQYKGVKVKKVTHKTTEKEINAEIDRLRERNARMVTVEDRAAQKDDTVVIDYEGFTGGVAFDGGKGEGYELTLGSGQFIPGFEDQLIGANAGDDVTVKVTFPTEYHSKDLAGKDAEFKVKVHAIKMQELPELDDEFAKDVSEFDTFAELKEDVTKKLKEANKNRSKQEFENNVLEAVAEATTIDIPQAMIDTNVENSIRDFAMQMQYQGIDLNQYMQMTGMTVDKLKAQFLPDAEKKVKMSLILEKVAKVENIEVSDDEVEAEYKNIADANKMKLEDVKKYLKAEDLKENKLVEKTVNFLVDNADTSK
ncbi:MAG: trigger factor [Clostridia bacterium]|nr:trigger factor [Clostridia bacterium]